MLRFFACLAIACFALACSDNKKGPSEADIKDDPIKAAKSLNEVICACKDAECLEALEVKGKAVKKAIKAKMKESPENAAELAPQLESLQKEAKDCYQKIKGD